MKIKEISYLVPPADLLKDSLDVFVYLEDEHSSDEFSYLVEVTTLQFLSALIEESESDFLLPDYPCIIVSKLTDEIITAAIQAFIDTKEDSFWLKLYHVTFTLNIKDLNEIIDRKKQESIELDAEIDAEMNAEINAEPDINH